MWCANIAAMAALFGPGKRPAIVRYAICKRSSRVGGRVKSQGSVIFPFLQIAGRSVDDDVHLLRDRRVCTCVGIPKSSGGSSHWPQPIIPGEAAYASRVRRAKSSRISSSQIGVSLIALPPIFGRSRSRRRGFCSECLRGSRSRNIRRLPCPSSSDRGRRSRIRRQP